MAERKRSKSGNKTRATSSGPSPGTSPPAKGAAGPEKLSKSTRPGTANPPEEAARPPGAEADPALFASARSKRRRTRLLGVLLFTGVVVGAALYGLWPLIMEGVRPGSPVEPAPLETSAPEPPLPVILPPVSVTDSDGLGARLAAVERNLAGLTDPQAAVDALTERIATLEAAGEEMLSTDTELLAARLDEIGARLALGAGATDDGTGATLSETLVTELATLGETLAALSMRLDVLEAQKAARPDPGVESLALVLGLAQLRDALARGAPFAAELASIAPLLANWPGAPAAFAALEAHSEHGVPTRESLRARFPAFARAVVTAALAPEGAGWVDQTLQKLAGVVSVRRTGDDIEGDSAEARVARAEVRLAAGELADAVAELDGLKGAAREAARGWLSDARARLGSEDALALMGRVVAASLAGVSDEAGAP